MFGLKSRNIILRNEMSNYLTGDQLDKSNLKAFIGQRVIFLFSRDIDRSGRGYFFPRAGTISEVNKRTIEFDDNRDYKYLVDLREIVLATPKNIQDNFK